MESTGDDDGPPGLIRVPASPQPEARQDVLHPDVCQPLLRGLPRVVSHLQRIVEIYLTRARSTLMTAYRPSIRWPVENVLASAKLERS